MSATRSSRAWWWAGVGVVLVAGLGVFLTVGCNPPAEVVPSNALRDTRAGADVLVVAYSRSGHTARAARALAEAMNADYIRIQGQGGEGDSFFKTPSWSRRIPLRPEHVDIARYRLIVIATPIWYWRPTALVMTFIETHDLTGKDVALFYTYEGGLRQSAVDRFRERVTARGGRVVAVTGIHRKKLPPGETVETRARALARELPRGR